MILFVFEGKEREPQLYRAIKHLFFPKETDATEDCSVAILNAFPIFLYDYFE